MAAENPQDPGQIDISLQLAGQEEIRQLVAAVSTLSQNVATIREFGAEGANRAEQAQVRGFAQERTPTNFKEHLQQGRDRLNALASQGGPSTTGAESTDPTPGETSAKASTGEATATHTVDMQLLADRAKGNLAAKLFHKELPNDYDDMLAAGQRRRPTPRDTEAVELGQASSGASRGGGGEGPPGATAAQWEHNMYVQQQAPDMQMPRLGEFTIQDQLTMARDASERFATKRRGLAQKTIVEEAQSAGREVDTEELAAVTEGNTAGYAAAALGRAAQYAPVVSHLGDKVFGAGQGAGILGINTNPGQLLAESEGRGYSGAGATVQDLNIPGTNIGGGLLPDALNFSLPAPVRMIATEAGREGISREFGRAKERLRNPGLSNTEADTIEEIIRTRGMDMAGRDPEYSKTFRNKMSQVMGSSGALEGANTEIAASLVQEATQHGAVGINEFVDSLSSVPDTAAAAGVSMDEMLTHMGEMGEFFQSEIGGTKPQGAKYAEEWSATTALPGPVAQTLLSNPTVQGEMMANTGLLPEQFATLSGGEMNKNIFKTMDMFRDRYKGSTPDRVKTLSNGDTMVVPGSEGDARLSAKAAGMDIDMYNKYWKQQKEAKRLNKLNEVMDFRAGQSKAIRKIKDPDKRQAGLDALGSEKIVGGDDVTSQGDTKEMLRKAGFSKKQIASVFEGDNSQEKQKLKKWGLSQKQIDKIDGKSLPISVQNERIQKLMAERSGSKRDKSMTEGSSKVTLDLTDDAKQWFEEVKKAKGRDKRQDHKDETNQGSAGHGVEMGARGSAPAYTRPSTMSAPPGRGAYR